MTSDRTSQLCSLCSAMFEEVSAYGAKNHARAPLHAQVEGLADKIANAGNRAECAKELREIAEMLREIETRAHKA